MQADTVMRYDDNDDTATATEFDAALYVEQAPPARGHGAWKAALGVAALLAACVATIVVAFVGRAPSGPDVGFRSLAQLISDARCAAGYNTIEAVVATDSAQCTQLCIDNPSCSFAMFGTTSGSSSGRRLAVPTTSQEACVTSAGNEVGKPCMFPFTYHGTTYHKCTSAGGGHAWCFTEVDSDGNGIENKHGECPDEPLCYVGNKCTTPVCGANGYCVGFEDDGAAYCYGSEAGCLWNPEPDELGYCQTDADCEQFAEKEYDSKKYTHSDTSCDTIRGAYDGVCKCEPDGKTVVAAAPTPAPTPLEVFIDTASVAADALPDASPDAAGAASGLAEGSVVTIESVQASGFFASVPVDGSPPTISNGNNVNLQDSPASQVSQWIVRQPSTGRYTFESAHTPGFFLSVGQDGAMSTILNGNNVHVWDNPDSEVTQWIVEPKGEGVFTIESAEARGFYMSVELASETSTGASGDNVHLWDNPDKAVTQWLILEATSTAAPTTVAPTTVAPATVAPTTVAPTTVAPTTVAPTTVAPTTVAPTTVAPTTVAPTTVAPTTVAPTTVAPTTVAPTTVAPTTVAPTTQAATTPAAAPTAPPTSAPTPKPAKEASMEETPAEVANCVLASGTCSRETQSGSELTFVRYELRHYGCANWKDIELTRIKESTPESCKAACDDHQDCASFNFQSKACSETEQGLPVANTCMLFKTGCLMEKNSCWDLTHLRITTEPDELWAQRYHRTPHTGCENWKNIELALHTDVTMLECEKFCNDNANCRHYNYQEQDTTTCRVDTVAGVGYLGVSTGACYLFAATCKPDGNPCWHLNTKLE